jgi:hypothetical protein
VRCGRTTPAADTVAVHEVQARTVRSKISTPFTVLRPSATLMS